MAEDDLGPLGCAILGAVLVGLGLLVVLPTALAERRIDLNDTCKPFETGKCFSGESGVVESADIEAVKVLYDDGRKKATLYVVGETYPGRQARVRLERWNGDIVSIYEPATERRFRTIRWPNAGNSGGWVLLVPGALLLAWGLLAGVVRLAFRF